MTTTDRIKIIGKNAPPIGTVPGIVLVNPRFAHNVGMVVRLASCYNFNQVWFTGDRVRLDMLPKRRIPREERMKGYRAVEMLNFERPLEQFPSSITPVAVEVRANSERLQDFEHPENAVYVFGPEDGSVPPPLLTRCHRFVVIPTVKHYCLNLATAVATVLWDRAMKLGTVPDGNEPVGHEETDPEDMGIFNTNEGWP
jgi:tRNA(Leu) C34 or U34 (ribose-2'-O)-methylase TrmL